LDDQCDIRLVSLSSVLLGVQKKSTAIAGLPRAVVSLLFGGLAPCFLVECSVALGPAADQAYTQRPCTSEGVFSIGISLLWIGT
jgi:hypothetical protein